MIVALGRSFAIVALAALAAGCSPAAPPPIAPDSAAQTEEHGHPHPEETEHRHGAGPHGGALADWGGGKFHVEFTVDHDTQTATVYVLGSDEKTPAPIQAGDGKLLLSIEEPAFQVELAAQPLEGEAGGSSSCFVGQHEKLGIVQEFAGTVSGAVDGTPYAGEFREEPHADE